MTRPMNANATHVAVPTPAVAASIGWRAPAAFPAITGPGCRS